MNNIGKTLPIKGGNPHGTIVGNGDFRYRVDCHWGQLNPEKYPVENCHSLAFDSNKNIVMTTDHPQNNVIIYNKDGKLVDAWGTMFPGAHSAKVVNENGEDFIYLVDSGWIINRKWDGVSTDKWDSPFNKVIPQAGFIAKLTLDGRLLFTISHPQTIGIYTPEMPFNPTDIAIAPNGDLYVADGYGSDYIIQYDHQGRYIRHFGGHNNTNKDLNLINTHGLEIDVREKNNPKLMVSSRAEQSLKVFSLTGDYQSTLSVPGAWIHGPIFKNNHFYSPVCWSDIEGKNVDDSGFIAIFDQNDALVASIGAEAPVYVNNQLQLISTSWNVFNHCHGLCVDDDENLYVGQWRANQSYPWKLHRL